MAVRNVGVVGHQGAGKTTLVEALAFATGATTRLGRVEEGNTISDYDPEEQQRGMSISTSLVSRVVPGMRGSRMSLRFNRLCSVAPRMKKPPQYRSAGGCQRIPSMPLSGGSRRIRSSHGF